MNTAGIDPAQADHLAWAVVDAAPDGMIVTDDQGMIVLANTRAHELFGFGRSGDDLEGRSVEDLLPTSLRGSHETHRERYMSDPRRREMGSGLELVGRRADGTNVPVEVSLSPVEMNGDHYVVAAVRDVSERRAADATLREAQARLAMVDDRERIGRDLHDSVIQRLYGAGLALQAALGGAESNLRSAGQGTVDEIDVTIAEIRSVIHGLRRSEMASGFLPDRLQRVVDAQAVALNLSVTLHVVGRIDLEPGPVVAEAVVAVVREGISNAHRHGGASEVVVDLETGVDGVLQVTVHDDGAGFDPGAAAGGYGLGNMQARAVELGGHFSVDSAPGRGTTVRWEVPLAVE